MRATYINPLVVQASYQLKGDVAHHLVSVVRVELDEEILLLNGDGLVVRTRVSAVTKKELSLQMLDHKEVSRSHHLDLLLGIPKKDALDLCLKQAVELGFKRIYLARTDYSQVKLPETDRLKSLLTNALEQSNSPFLPEVIPSKLLQMPYSEYDYIFMMDSKAQSTSSLALKGKGIASGLLVVGPEGGFSPDEASFLHQTPNVTAFKLPTPILRTPTAVATGAGFIFRSLLD